MEKSPLGSHSRGIPRNPKFLVDSPQNLRLERGIWDPQGLNPEGFAPLGIGFGVSPDPAGDGRYLGIEILEFFGMEIQTGKPQHVLGEPLQRQLPIPIQGFIPLGEGKLGRRSRSWLEFRAMSSEFPIQPHQGFGIPSPTAGIPDPTAGIPNPTSPLVWNTQSSPAMGLEFPIQLLEFPTQPHHGFGIPNPTSPQVWNSRSNPNASPQAVKPQDLQDVGWEHREFPWLWGLWAGRGWIFPWILSRSQVEFPAGFTHRAAFAPQRLSLVQVPHGALCGWERKKFHSFPGNSGENPQTLPEGTPSWEFLGILIPFPPPGFG